MEWSAAWRTAFDTHLAYASRQASFAPPVVLPAQDSESVLVVCPPWRYPAEDFAREIKDQLHTPQTVVALVPPFSHPEGGREWWAYEEERHSDHKDESALARAGLVAASPAEVVASLRAVGQFVTELAASTMTLTLFGSSQGASVVAHVAMQYPSVRRSVAFQPAGVYETHWQPKRVPPIKVQVVEEDAAHGDIWTWRGRVGRLPKKPTRSLLVFVGSRDVVAPKDLLQDFLI